MRFARFRIRTIMVVIAALAVLLGVIPALDRYRLCVSARIAESDVCIGVSLFQWRPGGFSCGTAGCHATDWGFRCTRELFFRVYIPELIALATAIASLSVLAAYCQFSRRQQSLPSSAATHPNERPEPDRSGGPEEA
jgi:hypothetical protein